MSSFIDDVILKPTGLVGMALSAPAIVYNTLEPLFSNLAFNDKISNGDCLEAVACGLAFGLSYLLYKPQP